jgi:streptomycin 6-kinase
MDSYQHKDTVESFWERMEMIHGELIMARSFAPANIRKVVADEGITILEELDSSSSHYVAHVRDADGQEALLKATTPDQQGEREIVALHLWENSGITPKVFRMLAPGVHLREWVVGEQLDDLPEHGAESAELVGAGLRKLHLPENAVIKDFPSITEWLRGQPSYFRAAKHLSDEEKKIAIDLLGKITDNPGPEVLLHGDAYYRNILHRGNKLIFIDPKGIRGPAAFDIGCYISMTPSDDPMDVLMRTLEGYGPVSDGKEDKPDNAFELSLVLTLRSVERFRDEHGLAGKEKQLRHLADRLLEANMGS